MCGIAGAVCTASAASRDAVEHQLRELDHRGPDSWGTFAKEHGVIGQTRLAIIDLVTGDPPITDETGQVGVVLNGEIYNFPFLREQLARDGHRLATSTDTEVIAHLAESMEAPELARRLDGMFAFAVWDDRRQRLLLGRDRVGKKPLFYWHHGDRLVFGSEIKAVLTHPWVPRRLDDEAIPAYLTFGYVPSPRTIFAEIQSVPPGHVLTFDHTGTVRLDCYWEPRVPGQDGLRPLDVSLDEAATEVRARLRAAVARRLISDVPLGAFLSGGIDSSAVVGLMAEASSRPVRTFTIGFEDQEGFDERPFARTIAERFGTDHTEFVVQPHAVDLVERLVWHHDQPFGDSSAVPTYLLAELTRKSVTVALCGDGGDELFGGYERFPAAMALTRYQQLPAPVRRSIRTAVNLLPAGIRRSRVASLRRLMDRTELDVFDAYMSWVSFFPMERRREIARTPSEWGTDDYRRIWDSGGEAELLDRLLLVNLRTYLLDDLLPKVDRMSMAHALEVRAPFLDHELAEYALCLPVALRVRGTNKKRVLKHAVRDLVPFKLRHRRKQGFGIPLDRWFRSDLKPYVDATLGSPEARVRGHLRGETIDRLWSEHVQGRVNHGHALWALLTLEVFLRREGW
ncbi:MAG: asparagine synthase (glutamine-hydrolyzing) [Acidimicrobiales bacterium]